jgi:DNA-directed RNA polymerase specialized sigma24 family protein
VLVTVIRRLPKYEHRGDGSFRGWLFTVARNEAHDFRTRRVPRPLPASNGIETVPAAPPDAAPDEAEYRRAVAHRALELVRGDFEPRLGALRQHQRSWRRCSHSPRPILSRLRMRVL